MADTSKHTIQESEDVTLNEQISHDIARVRNQQINMTMHMLPRIHVDSKYMISLMFAGKYM